MRSALPKVLHRVGGLPMVAHVLRTAQAGGATAISVVVGPGQEPVEAAVIAAAPQAQMVQQTERLGTGHAVRQAEAAYSKATGQVIVLYGDNPLVSAATVTRVAAALDAGADMVVVGFRPADPTDLGRLLTENGR